MFLVKSLLQSVSLLITRNTKPQIKQFAECPELILANYKNISWRAF